ncbi:hypothetical protein GBF38_022336, partial [Nibea albiflora]
MGESSLGDPGPGDEATRDWIRKSIQRVSLDMRKKMGQEVTRTWTPGNKMKKKPQMKLPELLLIHEKVKMMTLSWIMTIYPRKKTGQQVEAIQTHLNTVRKKKVRKVNTERREEVPIKQSKAGAGSRRKNSQLYYLQLADGHALPVCKNLFCSTLGIAPRIIGSWLNRNINTDPPKPKTNRTECHQSTAVIAASGQRVAPASRCRTPLLRSAAVVAADEPEDYWTDSLLKRLLDYGKRGSCTEAAEMFSAAGSAGVSMATLDAVALVSSDYPPMESEVKFMFTISLPVSGDAQAGAAASPGEGRPAGEAEQPVTPVVTEVKTAGRPVTIPHFVPFSVESTPGSKVDARLKVRLARLQLEKEERESEREFQFRRELELKKLEADTAVRLRQVELQASTIQASEDELPPGAGSADGDFRKPEKVGEPVAPVDLPAPLPLCRKALIAAQQSDQSLVKCIAAAVKEPTAPPFPRKSSIMRGECWSSSAKNVDIRGGAEVTKLLSQAQRPSLHSSQRAVQTAQYHGNQGLIHFNRERVATSSNLGVYITEGLTWSLHTDPGEKGKLE